MKYEHIEPAYCAQKYERNKRKKKNHVGRRKRNHKKVNFILNKFF